MSSLLEQGFECLQRGDARGAVRHLEQLCLELLDGDEDPRALTWLGAAYGQCGRYDDAVWALERAVGLDPDIAQIHYNLGMARHHAGHRQSAIVALLRAVALQPQYPK